MRRTLFLVSAVAAATASSFAASSNIVGYVKLSLGQGFNLIANQLDNGAGNKVTALFTGVPDQFSVSKYNADTGFTTISYVDGSWEGGDVNMTLGPGEGAFASVPAGTAPVAVTFVGEVKTGTSQVNIAGGGKFTIVSSVIPQVLKLDAASGFPAADNDSVSRYSAAGFATSSFVDGAWEGATTDAPTVGVGEAFFVKKAGAGGTWTRTFNVN